MFENQLAQKEKIYVIQPILDGDYINLHEEIVALIDSADAEYVGTSYQKIKDINPATFIGSGKLVEIKGMIENINATTIIFNGDLSPSQTLNISAALSDIKVIDRTTLILDIFAQRANTAEGKTQVELAQLRYIYPRLKGKGIQLSKLGGGIGTRGPGETQLETDRRHIKTRINYLENQLKKLEMRRNLQDARRQKNKINNIAIVGYTNTGKSTLLNALSDADLLVKDLLFATLDPSIKQLKLADFDVLLTDTVGFISSLPHQLVKAFKSTLDAAVNSDLNLIVCDATADWQMQLDTTLSTLESMGCIVPYLLVINKCEKCEDFSEYPVGAIFISAKEKMGLDNLLEKITEHFSSEYINCKLSIEYEKLKEYSALKKYLKEKSVKYYDDYVLYDVTIPKQNLSKFSGFNLA